MPGGHQIAGMAQGNALKVASFSTAGLWPRQAAREGSVRMPGGRASILACLAQTRWQLDEHNNEAAATVGSGNLPMHTKHILSMQTNI